ncbi:PREDICTED: polycystic kidney disease 2-like 2 protein [Thamnophis sirtalis]|uniref:Polycystic kidney disease 2-like 2 protein n=1 Tax=Thamnophis sirtalis TaxID=35019 RepID=A0A6I9YTT8_9SAUR|nr:PREDICTED: polycystic kidney disease 2-like 2 protein [Thamnophis sirtalis]
MYKSETQIHDMMYASLQLAAQAVAFHLLRIVGLRPTAQVAYISDGKWSNVKPRLTHSRELEMKTTLQELLIYIIFLTDLCILTFGMVSTDMYYLNRVMANLFLETPLSEKDKTIFKTMGSITDFWEFLEGPLLDGLYWNTWYTENSTSTYRNSSHIYYENLLLGVAQIRQLKVRNNTCSVYPSFRAFMRECYGKYSYNHEDRESFGFKNDTAWHYYTSATLAPWHWGLIGLYNTGGFMFILSKSKNQSLHMVTFLKEHSWITRGTRVVFIDFSMYNANVNLFCIVRLTMEFPATGGIIPSWQFHSVKLLRYVTYYDYFLASCEVIFCLFIFTFLIQEFIKMRKLKGDYFRNAWNWLDMLLLLVSFSISMTLILDTSRDVSRIGDKDLMRHQISSGQYDTVSARDFQRVTNQFSSGFSEFYAEWVAISFTKAKIPKLPQSPLLFCFRLSRYAEDLERQLKEVNYKLDTVMRTLPPTQYQQMN